MSAAPPAPQWNADNLTQHHRERLRRDAGCFEELLVIVGRTMTESEYEARSTDAVDNSWGEYEGQSWDSAKRDWTDTRAYFVDHQLVLAVTDSFRRRFITCYHEHFDRRHDHVMAIATVGQRRLRYQEHLQFDIDTDQFRMQERVRGV